jgi:hypothetical protein
MHSWGDENFDWKALDLALDELYKWGVVWGRVGGQIKEKWGCARYYANFSDGTLHSLLYPGSYRIQSPMWFYDNIDYKIIRPIIIYTGLIKVIHSYQRYFYRLAYKKAIKKYPHIKKEILTDCQYPEFVKEAKEYFNKQ